MIKPHIRRVHREASIVDREASIIGGNHWICYTPIGNDNHTQRTHINLDAPFDFGCSPYLAWVNYDAEREDQKRGLTESFRSRYKKLAAGMPK